MSPAQQFRSTTVYSPGVQQRDLVLTPVEGGVRRREGGDLQRDRDQASRHGRVEDRGLEEPRVSGKPNVHSAGLTDLNAVPKLRVAGQINSG